MGIVSLIGVEAGQEIDNFQVILGGMTEVVLGQQQCEEQTPIEEELDVPVGFSFWLFIYLK